VVNSGFTEAAYRVSGGGAINIGGEITHDTDQATSAIKIQEGYARIDCKITQTGSTNTKCVNIFDGGQRVDIANGAEMIGLGSGTTRFLIHAQSPRHIKCGDATFEGAQAVVGCDGPVEFIAQDGLNNKTDVPDDVWRLNGAQLNIGGARPNVGSIPVSGESIFDNLDGVRKCKGAMWYSTTDEQPVCYVDGDDFAPLPLAIRRRNNVESGDLIQGEMAMDEANNRLVYKARGGTVHYWTPDGTL
jgi:hypothetical protein